MEHKREEGAGKFSWSMLGANAAVGWEGDRVVGMAMEHGGRWRCVGERWFTNNIATAAEAVEWIANEWEELHEKKEQGHADG